jgi:Protein of unknown function, DUF547
MSIKTILFSALTLLASFSICTATTPVVSHTAPVNLHRGLDSLLQQYVSETGVVNYKGLVKNKATLSIYLDSLAVHVPDATWSKEEEMAYWINAYNAYTLDLIVRNYPTTSILKFDGGKTWNIKRITLGGKKYSLDQIENEILRPKFKDARIHFAINCGAKSCPPLYNHAFMAETLDATLEARTRAFVNNKNFNTITSGAISVSKIFEWYAADFGSLIKFLNLYSNKKIKTNATIKHLEYNWDLNE